MSVELLYWSSSCGRYTLDFESEDQIHEIYHQGDCEQSTIQAMPYFAEQLKAFTPEICKELLIDLGYDETDVNKMSIETLHINIVWLAAGDVYDQINMQELCDWQSDLLTD